MQKAGLEKARIDLSEELMALVARNDVLCKQASEAASLQQALDSFKSRYDQLCLM